MRKRNSFLAPLFCLPLILGGFTVSCSKNTDTGDPEQVKKLKIEGEVKTVYRVGDTFERPTVYAIYGDNRKSDVTLYVKYSGFSLNREGEQTVTGEFKGLSFEYDINVVNKIKDFIASGVRTAFELGEEFSFGGGGTYLIYDDDTRELVPLNELEISGFDSGSLSDNRTVTLSTTIEQENYSVSYSYKVVSVISEEITSLEFSNVETEYDIDDDFIRPTAIANGSINVSDLVNYSYDLSQVGEQTVTGTYKGFSNTFDITVHNGNAGADPADIPSDTISGAFSITTEDGNVTQQGNIYTITSIGSYTVTGKLNDGQIVVNVPEDENINEDDDVVAIELAGTSITSTSGCPIHVIDSRDVEITAKKKKNNYLYDRSSLVDSSNEPTGAAIYVENGDLKLKGTGALVCISSNNRGIHGKDDVKLQKLTLIVKAVGDGIKGNDSIKISDDIHMDIVSGDDGLKTSSTALTNSGKQKGSIEISGGNITINSYCDAIDAAYDAIIKDTIDSTTQEVTFSPNIDIFTNRYSSYNAEDFASGTYVKKSIRADSTKVSSKGIKACNTIDISGGTIFIESYDDGIHGNAKSGDTQIVFDNGNNAPGNVDISGGKLTVSSTDDGIHADGTLTISGEADINIEKSFEGLEGHVVNMTGGSAIVNASEDGLNAVSTNSRVSNAEVNISGGYLDITVPNEGDVDGIDSNGTYTQTGGIVITRGPAMGGFWSLDTDSDTTLNGGTLIVVGGIEASESNGGRPNGGGGGHGGPGGIGGGTLIVGSNMTCTTSNTGKSVGTYRVTIANNVVATYTNIYSYSQGKVYIYSELGSATVSKA